jgi:hypothetical protein
MIPDEYYPTEVVEISMVEDRVANQYVVASVRMNVEEAKKLSLGRCKIENT